MKKVCCVNAANVAYPVAAHNRPEVVHRVKQVAGTGRLSLLFLLGVAFIAGVSPIPSRAQTLQWSTSCPAPPPGYPPDRLNEVECATLPVPLDYKNPNGATINLAISRILSSDPTKRRGVLLSNPGGPGNDGFDEPRLLFAMLPKSVLDEYDLIGFDPRFLHYSDPMTCGLSAEQTTQVSPPLPQPGGFDATVAYMQNVANSCINNSDSILPFVTTENTARDMDEIRKAIGETQISYVGASYGTYLGAVYATLFPNQTDRFVLDSAVDPQWVWQTVFDAWGLGGQIRFPDFANFAAANDATYGLGNTPDEINRLFFTLENELNQRQSPVTVTVGPLVLVLDGPTFVEETFAGLAIDELFPTLAQVWQQLQQQLNSSSVGAPNAGTIDTNVPTATSSVPSLQPASSDTINTNVPLDNVPALQLGILCGDTVWPKSIAEYKARLEADSLAFPMFGALGSNIWACAFWPTKNTPIAIRPNGPSNIMILENQRDPVTPYPGALQLNADLGQRTTFVSVDQGGHGVYLSTPNICANNAATAFLASGTFPGGFVSCPANLSTSQPNWNANAKFTDSERERARQEFERLIKPPKFTVLKK